MYVESIVTAKRYQLSPYTTNGGTYTNRCARTIGQPHAEIQPARGIDAVPN